MLTSCVQLAFAAAVVTLATAPDDADPDAAARNHLGTFARHAGLPPCNLPFGVLIQAFA